MMFTGDDFNYAELIAGDGKRHSHALLGIFDAIAPVASAALAELAAGDGAGFHALMTPTVPLSRKIFEAPTQYYKAGVVFLAWLNGHPGSFRDGRRHAVGALDRPLCRCVPAGRPGPAASSIPTSPPRA